MSRQVEAAGFTTLWLPEATQPVFSTCTAAALATSSLHLGTGVAVAFPRSPMLTAQAAWMLAQATDGRFVVGLGTQVRAHVERRFSAEFSHPGPRLREYVEAMRAIYRAFRGDEKLAFDGTYYSFSLLTPVWSPGPMEHPDPPIYVAGVRDWMCRMAGTTRRRAARPPPQHGGLPRRGRHPRRPGGGGRRRSPAGLGRHGLPRDDRRVRRRRGARSASGRASAPAWRSTGRRPATTSCSTHRASPTSPRASSSSSAGATWPA